MEFRSNKNQPQRDSKINERISRTSGIKNQEQSALGATNSRTGALEQSARGAIWRRKIPTNEKNDRLLRREEVITHGSRPEGPANLYIYSYSHGFSFVFIPKQ